MYDQLNLRVFRRTKENIGLLWSKKKLHDDQLTYAKIFLKDRDDKGGAVYRELTFHMTDALVKTEIRARTPENTALALIDHELNQLDCNKDYEVKLVIGTGTNQIEQVLKVYKFGVLPDSERDSREANVHIMGWNEDERHWFKIPLRKTSKGGYALPVVIVEDQRNGHKE